jgi:aspartyl-tRNA(Asn)/glutamyl-tRNA(Gln) amidotransferase subunit A
MIELPAEELGPLLRRRKVSPVELVRACLQQIEKLNPQVQAFLTVTGERALAAAREAEEEIRRGRYRGPLHGIPYAPKDILATKGIRTTNGSRVTAEWVPEYESTVTERLGAAGAILVGKLNLLEFAMGSGQRGLVAPARNPWSLAHSPSGSSSGSGAALAARMVPLTVGTDTGGSIRGPAKSCGVVGLKPTYGRVSREGVTALSWTLDHVGPMARTVGDVAAMFAVMAGAKERSGVGVKGLRIGVAEGHFFEHLIPEVARALRAAMGELEKLGAERVEVKVENAAMASPALSVILGAESASVHAERLRESAGLMDPLVRERLEANSLYSAMDYIHALRVRTVMKAEMRRVLAGCDAVLLPAGNPAPLLEEEIVETDLPPAVARAPRPDVMNLANLTGIPALVLPCGFTAGPPALPIGMQLWAKPFGEAMLFRIGQAYQGVTDWHQRAPGMVG